MAVSNRTLLNEPYCRVTSVGDSGDADVEVSALCWVVLVQKPKPSLRYRPDDLDAPPNSFLLRLHLRHVTQKDCLTKYV